MKTPDRLSRATETMARAGREAALFARRASARYADHFLGSPVRVGRPGPEAFMASLAARRHRLLHLDALTASSPAVAGLRDVLRTASYAFPGRAAVGGAKHRTRTLPAGRTFLTSGASRSLIMHTPLTGVISSALPPALQFTPGLAASPGQRGRPGDIPVLTRLTFQGKGPDIAGIAQVPTITQTQVGQPLSGVNRFRAADEPLTPVSRPWGETPDRLLPRRASEADLGRDWAAKFRPVLSSPDGADASGTPDRIGRSGGYLGLGPSLLRATLVRQGGSGSTLDHALRTKLGSHLHFDLGVARLHRGVAAGAAARELKAQAFTIGRDVFFGESRYDPGSREGLGLLAHELTHVGQQTRGIREGMHFFTPSGGGALEEEARQTAGKVLAQSAPPREAPDAISQTVSARTAPAMTYAMREISQGETQPAHGTTAPTQRSSAAGEKHDAQKPDPHVVTDRVYDLMKKELVRDRHRGVFAPS